MAITTNAIANSFKKQLLEGGHNFTQTTGNVFKLALYTSSATLGASTTSFTTDNQVTASGQYVDWWREVSGWFTTNICSIRYCDRRFC
jgi:hypothetical protein